MHRQRIAIGITAGIGVLCTFLPWLVGVPWRGTVNGTGVEGGMGGLWLSAAVVVGMFVGRRNQSLTPGGYGLCRVMGGLIALVGVYVIGNLSTIGAGSHIGVGPYFVVVVGIAIAVLPNVVRAG